MKPIQIKNLGFSSNSKSCFNNFNAEIHHGSRIAIIGDNGSGKSSLLKMLQGIIKLQEGRVIIPDDMTIGYVPQIIEEFLELSGGQRLNKALSQAIGLNPDLLLLDEPTNHLDLSNKRSLIRWLKSYRGTLIVVSHDLELLRSNVDILWHIHDQKIEIFNGNYDDYVHQNSIKRAAIEQKLHELNRNKKQTHQSLMKEQHRAKNSRLQGENHIERRKWPTVTSAAKAARAETTSGRKKLAIREQREDLIEQLSDFHLPEIITPKFLLNPANNHLKTLITIADGEIYYQKDRIILEKINFSLSSNDKIAISGNNASGKSSLIKAIMQDSAITKLGNWNVPRINDIGYLDQHYSNLDCNQTVFTIIENAASWQSPHQIRCHLNDFLFRKNEEINNQISNLSGGEKARLSLALIAANPPKLLILDEITNNLDLTTKNHVIQILREYPGAMIVISHDQDFLRAIDVKYCYQIQDGILV